METFVTGGFSPERRELDPPGLVGTLVACIRRASLDEVASKFVPRFEDGQGVVVGLANPAGSSQMQGPPGGNIRRQGDTARAVEITSTGRPVDRCTNQGLAASSNSIQQCSQEGSGSSGAAHGSVSSVQQRPKPCSSVSGRTQRDGWEPLLKYALESNGKRRIIHPPVWLFFCLWGAAAWKPTNILGDRSKRDYLDCTKTGSGAQKSVNHKLHQMW